MEGIRFAILSSGSKGNSALVWDSFSTIMIDAGISYKRYRESLSHLGIRPQHLSLFLTHEHTDHSSGLRTLIKREDLDIYSRKGTLEYLSLDGDFYIVDREYVGDFEISAIGISHDAVDPVAYIIRHSEFKITIASDMGVVGGALLREAKGSDILAFESNHDVEMLRNGRYPYFLKNRIISDSGHLSNSQSSEAISKMVEPKTRIILTHLSEENNRPDIALNTVRGYLENRHIGYRSLETASQWKISAFYHLGRSD